MNLKGKNIVITGGSSGIGASTAKKCAAQGARVGIISRSEESLKRVVKEIKAKGGKADYQVADLKEKNQFIEALNNFLKNWGSIEGLVNNAMSINASKISDQSMEDWRENFKGLEYIDNELGLIFTGAVDDLWLNLDNNKVIVVDYKATSKVGSIEISNSGWWPSYKRQIEFYQFQL